MFTYTKLQIIKEARVKIITQENRQAIAQWAYQIFLEPIKDYDHQLEQFLIDLSCMQQPQDNISYEELEDKIETFNLGEDFIYDRLEFAKELRQLLRHKTSIIAISQWAYKVFMQRNSEQSAMVHNIAYTLSFMEEGPEFEYSYEELHSIVNRLIAGENVRL